MRWIAKCLLRIGSLFRRDQVEVRLSDELQFHVEQQIQENLAAGMTPDEARYAALRTIGGIEQIKEECRDERGVNLIEDVGRDLRYALRILRRTPGLTAAITLSLALGIGANTAVFSVVDGVLLRPLPYPHPERLVAALLQQKGVSDSHPFGIADFLAWRERQQSFEHVAAHDSGQNYTLTGLGNPEQLVGFGVTADFFSTLEAQPMLGKTFGPDADLPGKPLQAVVGESFWRSHLGADPNAIGRSITLDSRPYTVIAVMPAWFRFPKAESVDVWAIRTLNPPQARPPYFLFAFGRLKPGVSLQRAEAELAMIAGQVSQQYPSSPYAVGSIQPLKQWMVQRVRTALLVILAAVALVLLIALVNVANLLLSRATTREQEMAMRLALGAGRWRLIRQLLAESLLLSLAGGAVGLALAAVSVRAFVHFGPGGLPRVEEVGINLQVLVFTAIVSVTAGVFFGLAPALQSTRAPVNEALKSSTAVSGSQPGERVRRVLVICELALTLMLMIGAGLLIRTFLTLREVNPGFAPSHLLTMLVGLPKTHYAKEPNIANFWQQFLLRVERIPGVKAAGITMSLPPNLLSISNPFTVEGQPYDRSRPLQLAEEMTISPNYFRALGVPLVRGRVFTDTDGRKTSSDPKASAPMVVIINETMAKKFFPHEDPIGKRLQTGDPDPKSPWETIVGVVGDVKYSGLDSPPTPQLYVPYTEEGWTSWSREMFVVVRTSVPPTSVLPGIRSQLGQLDPQLALAKVRTMDQLLDESVTQQRFRGLLLGGFAGVALLLAAIGLYAVISYSVGQRTHEIGLRMALGAQRADVLQMVIGQAAQVTFVGLAIGVIGAFAITRMMASLLFGISATDLFSFIVTSAVLLLVAVVASYMPARRAMNLDPVRSLRYE